MTLGKREQAVIGSVGALVLILILHLAIFGPQAGAVAAAKSEYDTKAATLQSLVMLTPQQKAENTLGTFNEQVGEMLARLREGITDLELEEPEAFTMPTIESIQLDPPPPPGTTPDEISNLKNQELERLIQQRKQEQIDLLLAEVEHLRSFRENPTTRMNFLGPGTRTYPGWNIPRSPRFGCCSFPFCTGI